MAWMPAPTFPTSWPLEEIFGDAVAYPWPGRNHYERCDDTGTSDDQIRLEVAQQTPTVWPIDLELCHQVTFNTCRSVSGVPLVSIHVLRSEIAAAFCAAQAFARAVRTASARAASLIADTLSPKSRPATKAAAVRVMFVRCFSVVLGIITFSAALPHLRTVSVYDTCALWQESSPDDQGPASSVFMGAATVKRVQS